MAHCEDTSQETSYQSSQSARLCSRTTGAYDRQNRKLKASIRAKAEYAFHIVKNLFKYKKVSYKGIAKNAARHVVLFALANLVIVKKHC